MPLLVVIRLYWLLWPATKRRTCLFRQSCSRHVFQVTRRRGLRAGVWALRQRVGQCRPGSYSFRHPITGEWLLHLPDGTLLPAYAAARHLRPGA